MSCVGSTLCACTVASGCMGSLHACGASLLPSYGDCVAALWTWPQGWLCRAPTLYAMQVGLFAWQGSRKRGDNRACTRSRPRSRATSAYIGSADPTPRGALQRCRWTHRPRPAHARLPRPATRASPAAATRATPGAALPRSRPRGQSPRFRTSNAKRAEYCLSMARSTARGDPSMSSSSPSGVGRSKTHGLRPYVSSTTDLSAGEHMLGTNNPVPPSWAGCNIIISRHST